ncbi:TonB family protein [Methylomonas sp. HYX-M1]|uniref:energy transducer TonB n=1 Tax=Methylomonas sp. HYX-M1 TaxID=3139307 RepID=UPI00345BF822
MGQAVLNWLARLREQRIYLLDVSALPEPDNSWSVTVPHTAVSLRRSLALTAVALLVALLHAYLLFWYATRPQPLPFSAAAPLPMIAMELSAPPAPQAVQAPQPPKPETPKEAKPKPAKPKIKPKPKVAQADDAPKRKLVEPQAEQPQPQSVAAAAVPTPVQQAPAAPRNDVYQPVDSNAAYLNNPKPDYPLSARQRGWQGTVVLRVLVAADGRAEQVNVQRSSGHEVLDESALDAVRDWRFVPAKRGDVAEPSWVSIPIVFSLR